VLWPCAPQRRLRGGSRHGLRRRRARARQRASTLARGCDRCLRGRTRHRRRHAAALRLSRVELRHGDWYQPLLGERFDLLVSNPPYVAQDDPALATSPSARTAAALTPGADALSCLRTLVRGAPRHLAPGGWLLLEHGATQARTCGVSLSTRASVTYLAPRSGRPRAHDGRTAMIRFEPRTATSCGNCSQGGAGHGREFPALCR